MIWYMERPFEGENKGISMGVIIIIIIIFLLLTSIPIGTNMRLSKIPYATIGLLLINWLVYAFTAGMYYKTAFVILRYFYLYPGEAHPWQLVTSMFFHANFGHLLGNSIFLAAFGIFVEDKVGWKQYLFLYFLTGIAAGLIHSTMAGLFMRGQLDIPELGASGAISGIMGIFLYRCYYAKVRVLVLFFIPVQVPAVILLVLFFLRDFIGGIAVIKGGSLGTAFWAHVGGFLSGFATSKYLKYEGQAKKEKLEHTVTRRLGTRDGFAEGMVAAELLLQTDANNPQLHLKMAQAKSRMGGSKEGKEHYEQAIKLMLDTDRDKVVAVFVEYWKKYLTVIEPQYQLRVSRLLASSGNTSLARATLEALINGDYPPDRSIEAAYFDLAKLYEQQLQQYDLARAVYQQYMKKFPQTEHKAFVESKLRLMQGGARA
jgi:membrane associated rhomboid family serine protease